MAEQTLHEKIVEIQQCLKAPKSQYNKFGGYHYRNCEDILEAVKPLLPPAILKITDELVMVGDRYYVKATACIIMNGKTECGEAYARETETKKGMDSSQITGATSSYARKYALNGLFCIDDTQDADSDKKPQKRASQSKKTTSEQKNPEKKEPASEPPHRNDGKLKAATKKQRGFIWNMCKEHSLNEAESKELLDFATDGHGLNIQNASVIIDRMVKDWDGLLDDFLEARKNSEPPDTEPPLLDDEDIPL
jgi:hypothetical protein